jgi:hypothetical protein
MARRQVLAIGEAVNDKQPSTLTEAYTMISGFDIPREWGFGPGYCDAGACITSFWFTNHVGRKFEFKLKSPIRLKEY